MSNGRYGPYAFPGSELSVMLGCRASSSAGGPSSVEGGNGPCAFRGGPELAGMLGCEWVSQKCC